MKPESILRQVISFQQDRMNPDWNEAGHLADHAMVYRASNMVTLAIHQQVMTSEYKDW